MPNDTARQSPPSINLPLSEKGERLVALLRTRIVYLDGAMGTLLQRRKFSEADFRGARFAEHSRELKGDGDVLSLTQPEAVADCHRAYFEAGADIVTTNSFIATAVSQADYGLEQLVREMNTAAAGIAARVARETEAAEPGRECWVAGSIGPTNRSLSFSRDVADPGARDATFAQLRDDYREAVGGLLDGGADVLLLETIFDTLNAKAALFAIGEEFAARRQRWPLVISGTIADQSGRTLTGQTTEAFWNSVRHAAPLAIGMNCALGAAQMRPFIAELAAKADCFVSCHPNAGLPDPLSPTGFPEGPEDTAMLLREFADAGIVNIVGGCCGTTPEHIRAIVRATRHCRPRQIPAIVPALRLSGLDALNSLAPQEIEMLRNKGGTPFSDTTSAAMGAELGAPFGIVKRATMPRTAHNKQTAEVAAAPFIGKILTNKSDGTHGVVSKKSLQKMFSGKAVKKSANVAAHFNAVANADWLFENAELALSHPDTKPDVGQRHIKSIHRYLAPMLFAGEIHVVKITVKEFLDQNTGNKIYSVEAMGVSQKQEPATGAGSSRAGHSGQLTGGSRTTSLVSNPVPIDDLGGKVAALVADVKQALCAPPAVRPPLLL
ncbi:MAG: homocysteine S-methyltransferase family protein, partial [Puniceicoccales bacterium]|nr:homocysteine S-methyltransferase family protein [Puniceicoccales bacterium]